MTTARGGELARHELSEKENVPVFLSRDVHLYTEHDAETASHSLLDKSVAAKRVLPTPSCKAAGVVSTARVPRAQRPCQLLRHILLVVT